LIGLSFKVSTHFQWKVDKAGFEISLSRDAQRSSTGMKWKVGGEINLIFTKEPRTSGGDKMQINIYTFQFTT
jgi:hypothetical protein